MKDLDLITKEFQQSGLKSYAAARLLVCSNYLAPIGLYNAHLACECLIKSLIAQEGVNPKFGHDLTSLLNDLRKLNKSKRLDESRLKEICEWLNPYQELGRYGALAQAKNDPSRKDDGILQVRGAISYRPSADIREIDYAFSLLFGLLNEAQPLISVFAKHQWKLPILLEEVLYSENDFLTDDGSK